MKQKEQQVRASTCLASLAAGVAMCLSTSAFADVIYNSMPIPQPGNVPSQAYQATQTKEFGSFVKFAPGGARNLTSVSVLLSNWAVQSNYPGQGTAAGFEVPLTLSLYNVGAGNAVGSLLSSQTMTSLIPWRPEANGACGVGDPRWQDSTHTCYNGMAYKVTFDFSGIVVPDSLIFGLALDAQTSGYNPVGTSGPYNSLNFGVNVAGPSVGNTLTDINYLNSAWSGAYTDHGALGTNTFRQDAGWGNMTAAAEFQAVPEPASLALLGLGLAAFGLTRRKRLQ